MRTEFAKTVLAEMDADPRVAVVIAAISRDLFPHTDRVIDVGIREQAMVGVAGGLALTGLRPIVHTYAPFLVERPFEQIKLDLGHQEVGAVLVSVGASYDDPAWGRTHQAPGDVALFDTLPGWTVHVPGHSDEVGPLVRDAIKGDGRVYIRLSMHENAQGYPVDQGVAEIRRGRKGVVLAVGPVLDRVVKAVEQEQADVTVLYASTVRPFDGDGLRAALAEAERSDVMLVEPYLEGTSAHVVTEALEEVPHRLRSVGVKRHLELHAYGTAADHDAAHDLDVVGIAAAVRAFFHR